MGVTKQKLTDTLSTMDELSIVCLTLTKKGVYFPMHKGGMQSFLNKFIRNVSGGVLLLLLSVSNASALPLVLDVEADTTVRTDQGARRNDNYGKTNTIMVGTGRGGGGIPFGGPDAIRSLLRFDLTGTNVQANSAILELTISSASPAVFEVGVYQVLGSWIEGNGCEGPFSTTSGCPLDSVFVDEAFGAAWEGTDTNNETQPAFDPTVITIASVDTNIAGFGDVVKLDITSLYNSWIFGTPNEGLLLRDITSDGTFREIVFGSRDDLLFLSGNAFPNAPAARLVVNQVPVPEPSTILLLSSGLLGLASYRWQQRRRGRPQLG